MKLKFDNIQSVREFKIQSADNVKYYQVWNNGIVYRVLPKDNIGRHLAHYYHIDFINQSELIAHTNQNIYTLVVVTMDKTTNEYNIKKQTFFNNTSMMMKYFSTSSNPRTLLESAYYYHYLPNGRYEQHTLVQNIIH